MSIAALNYEETNRRVEAVLTAYAPGGKRYISHTQMQEAPEEILPRVCELYHGISPILEGVRHIPFLPDRWREAVKLFLDAMGSICVRDADG